MTREEAAANLLQYLQENEKPGSVWAESLSMAVLALRERVSHEEKAKASDEKQAISDWISVEERLPEKITNKVLVYCKNGYIGFGHYENFRGVEDWYNLENGKPFREWDLEDCETYEVTHWMPLPEAPEVEV